MIYKDTIKLIGYGFASIGMLTILIKKNIDMHKYIDKMNKKVLLHNKIKKAEKKGAMFEVEVNEDKSNNDEEA